MDIVGAIDSAERRILETDDLLRLLRDPEFILPKMGTVKDAFGGNPPLGLTLSQLYTLLFKDDRIRKIIRRECEPGFERKRGEFSFFIFFCTVFVYAEYVNITKSKEMQESGGKE